MSAFTQLNRSPINQSLAGTVTQIGAGSVAVVKIPPGATYATISIRLGIAGALSPAGAGTAPTKAQIGSMLTQWRLTVGGIEMWTLTGVELCAIQEYYNTGVIGATGVMSISFQRGWMKGFSGFTADLLGPDYGTYKQSSFQLEITQDATSTITNFDVFAEVEPVAEQLGAHVEFKKVSPNFTSTGTFIYPDLFKDPAAIMFSLFIETNDITKLSNVAVVADGTYIWDAPLDVGYAWSRAQYPLRTPQSAVQIGTIDFTRRGLGSDAVPLNMANLLLRLTFTAAPTTLNVIQEVGIVTPDVV